MFLSLSKLIIGWTLALILVVATILSIKIFLAHDDDNDVTRPDDVSSAEGEDRYPCLEIQLAFSSTTPLETEEKRRISASNCAHLLAETPSRMGCTTEVWRHRPTRTARTLLSYPYALTSSLFYRDVDDRDQDSADGGKKLLDSLSSLLEVGYDVYDDSFEITFKTAHLPDDPPLLVDPTRTPAPTIVTTADADTADADADTDAAATSVSTPLASSTSAPPPTTTTPAPTTRRPLRPGPFKTFYSCVEPKMVALTFDDGPVSGLTPRVLDALKAYDAKASFFVIGRRVAQFQPESTIILQRILEEGHSLGSHTYTHPNLQDLFVGEVVEELEQTDRVLRQATGGRDIKYFRPPYLSFNTIVESVTEDMDYLHVQVSVDSHDWYTLEAAEIKNNILTGVRNFAGPGGPIVLQHDLWARSVDTVEDILQTLSGEGYTFVNLDTCLGDVPRPSDLNAWATFSPLAPCIDCGTISE